MRKMWNKKWQTTWKTLGRILEEETSTPQWKTSPLTPPSNSQLIWIVVVHERPWPLEAEISQSIWTLQYDLDLILDPNSVQPFNKLINTQVWWWRWKLKFLSSICHSCDKWRREDRGIFCSRLRLSLSLSLSLSLKMKCWWWIK